MATYTREYLLICTIVLVLAQIVRRVHLYFRLRYVPGPRIYGLTSLRLAYDAWHARSIHAIRDLHQAYGPVVRVGPKQISFNSLEALRTIYGAGSGFERTPFYRMFDAYGTPNLFTFASGADHRNRKKLVSHMYSNQKILEEQTVTLVKSKVQGFLDMLHKEPKLACEIFTSLHYFSFDTISEFIYGPSFGGTNALAGDGADRRLIKDILDPARRRLAWFAVHYPAYTKWITTRTGFGGKLIEILGLLPMKRPFTYSGIRGHALKAFYDFKAAVDSGKQVVDDSTVIGRLFQIREKQELSDMDIASECADHLLAGIDTTSDSLMFLIWALSLPQHQSYQRRLHEELSNVTIGSDGWPDIRGLARLPMLNAILKESLRLYTPLPAFEPRQAPLDTIIDGFPIPADTIVGMSPYCMHRNESVFLQPELWKPERWLDDTGALLSESAAQNKWFWAFSSGARMCIGMHLANTEIIILVAAVYLQFKTIARRLDASPAITSRYEVFGDETMHEFTEHECFIDFEKL